MWVLQEAMLTKTKLTMQRTNRWRLYLAHIRYRQALHGGKWPRRNKQLRWLCEIRPVTEAAGNRWAQQASLHAVTAPVLGVV